ncbi:MAG: alpha/beta hydrolase [Candidatus Acidiferrum sp.]|jgi:acetyl esterase/lipase
MKSHLLPLAVALVLLKPFVSPQEPPSFAVDVGNDYWIQPDVVYGIENGHQNKLDVIYPHNATTAVPAVIYIHGGGWFLGDKAGAVLETLPYLKMGWAAVNVEYRMAGVSKAPGAVEDCRCALRWVVRNAKEYHIDPARLVATGHSAGGHLSLTTGMLKESDGLDTNCPGDKGESEPRIAAIVNWYGITNVADLLAGGNRKTYAIAWLGSAANKAEVARRVSPLTYVREDSPPTITIHGDADDVVPYSHALQLQQALDKAGVPNQLFTVKGGGHGQFSDEDNEKAYAAIFEFLAKRNLGPIK